MNRKVSIYYVKGILEIFYSNRFAQYRPTHSSAKRLERLVNKYRFEIQLWEDMSVRLFYNPTKRGNQNDVR